MKIIIERKTWRFLFKLVLALFILAYFFGGFITYYFSVSISPDNKMFVVTTPRELRVYNAKSGWVLHREKGQFYGYQPYGQGVFSNIAWSPDGSALAVEKINNGILVLDTRIWEILTDKSSEPKPSTAEPGFAWSPDGKKLAYGSGARELLIWDKATNKWEKQTSTLLGVSSLKWMSDGRLLAISGGQIYDTATGKNLNPVDLNIDGYGKISWNFTGDYIYTFFDLGGGVLDVKTNEYIIGAGYFPKFAWSQDGTYFAKVQECSNEFFIWNLKQNKLIRQERQGMVIYALTWDKDDNLLALGVRGLNTALWNTETGKVMKWFFRPPNWFCSLESFLISIE